MRFVAALIGHGVIGLILGWGVLLSVKREPWLLIVGFLAYAFAFAKLGCLPQKSR